MSYPNKFKIVNTASGLEFTLEKEITQWRCVWGDNKREYFSEYMIDTKIKYGLWEIIKEGPEMVFPFTFHTHCGVEYRATQAENMNRVDIYRADYPEEFTHNYWNKKDIAENIKNGSWVVTSVGEQKAPEAPKASILDSITVTINANTKAATEAVNALADAGNKAAEAMLVLKCTIEDVASVLNGGGFVKELKDDTAWPDLEDF